MKIALLLALVAAPVMADDYQITMPTSSPAPQPIYAIPSNSSFQAPADVPMPAIPQDAANIKIDNSHLEVAPTVFCIETYVPDVGMVTSCQ